MVISVAYHHIGGRAAFRIIITGNTKSVGFARDSGFLRDRTLSIEQTRSHFVRGASAWQNRVLDFSRSIKINLDRLPNHPTLQMLFLDKYEQLANLDLTNDQFEWYLWISATWRYSTFLVHEVQLTFANVSSGWLTDKSQSKSQTKLTQTGLERKRGVNCF